MHMMLRTYSGPEAKAFAKLMEEEKADVERVARSVNDIVSFTFASTSDGAISVTVGETKIAVDELHKKAMEWIKDKAAQTKVKPPAVLEGSVVVHV